MPAITRTSIRVTSKSDRPLLDRIPRILADIVHERALRVVGTPSPCPSPPPGARGSELPPLPRRGRGQGEGSDMSSRIIGLDERVMYAPVWELGPMVGVGLRVDEAGVGLTLGDPYSAPYEADVRLERPETNLPFGSVGSRVGAARRFRRGRREARRAGRRNLSPRTI
jgi:hypothetical protein